MEDLPWDMSAEAERDPACNAPPLHLRGLGPIILDLQVAIQTCLGLPCPIDRRWGMRQPGLLCLARARLRVEQRDLLWALIDLRLEVQAVGHLSARLKRVALTTGTRLVLLVPAHLPIGQIARLYGHLLAFHK